jgi:hypothetical protein
MELRKQFILSDVDLSSNGDSDPGTPVCRRGLLKILQVNSFSRVTSLLNCSPTDCLLRNSDMAIWWPPHGNDRQPAVKIFQLEQFCSSTLWEMSPHMYVFLAEVYIRRGLP